MSFTDKATAVITEDGVTLQPGDNAYNYYDMKPGKIPTEDRLFSYYNPDAAPDAHRDIWFKFQHTDGTVCLLNGERICTVAFARRRGFPGA